VFISGCEQGLIPYALYEQRKADEAEERRLLYVAMTRAEKYLFLTHASRRFINGREWKLPRSSFLDDIDLKLTELRDNQKNIRSGRNRGQLNLFK
jgi:superfamily I DNA/RNA helicase